MTSRRYLVRAIALVSATALVAGLIPAAAGGAPNRSADGPVATTVSRASKLAGVKRDKEHRVPVGDAVKRPRLSAQAATDAPDGYEQDDTAGTARTLPDPYAYFAATPYTEQHSLDAARGATASASWDEDWYEFTLTEDDIRYTGVSLLIEAWTADPAVDTVIELYNDGAVPTDPRSLIDADGDGYTDMDPEAIAGSDEDFWFANHGSSLYVPFDPADWATLAGTYLVRVRPYYQGDFANRPAWMPVGFNNGAGDYQLRWKVGEAERLSGASRYDTGVDISSERYPDGYCDGYYITVASGKGYADALAGSTLSGAAGGPLLLTDPGTLPTSVRNEILRLAQDDPVYGDQGSSLVFILGGPGAVSNSVMAAIDALPDVDVMRISDPANPTRYGTAAEIARTADDLIKSVEPTWGVPPIAFIASGKKYADALAASPMATWNFAPVLLTDPNTLPQETIDAMDDLGITDAIIVGGTGAVSANVETQLNALLGGNNVERIAGASRYQTARTFAEWSSDLDGNAFVGTTANPDLLMPLYPELVGLANGRGYADALAGGVLCGKAGVPLLLNDLDSLSQPEVVTYCNDVANCPDTILYKPYAFGGAGAISAEDFLVFDYLTVPYWVEDPSP